MNTDIINDPNTIPNNLNIIQHICNYLESTFCDIVIFGFPNDYINSLGQNIIKEFENIFKVYDSNAKIYGYYPTISSIDNFQGYFLGFGTNMNIEARDNIVNNINNGHIHFNNIQINAQAIRLNPVISQEQILNFYSKYNNILQADNHYFLSFKNKYDIQENNRQIIQDSIAKINAILLGNFQNAINEKNQLIELNKNLNQYLKDNYISIENLKKENEKLREKIDLQRVDNRTDLIGFRKKINDEIMRNNILQDDNIKLRNYIKELEENYNNINENYDETNYIVINYNKTGKIPEYMHNYRWYFLDDIENIRGPYNSFDMRAWYEEGYFENIRIRYENNYERSMTFRYLHEIWENPNLPFIERPKDTYNNTKNINYQNNHQNNYQHKLSNFNEVNNNNSHIIRNDNKFSLLGDSPNKSRNRKRNRNKNRRRTMSDSSETIVKTKINFNVKVDDTNVEEIEDKINKEKCNIIETNDNN